MLLKVYYENLIWIPIILGLCVILIIYYLIRDKKLKKAYEIRALYDYVLKKYGKDYIGFYKSAKIKQEFTTKNLEVCEYIEFTYTDENGNEKVCKSSMIDRLDVDWISKQTNGVKIRVFEDLAVVDLSEADSSNVNLAEGYTDLHAIVAVSKGIFSILFYQPKIDERFKPYYTEFKRSEDYKKFKEKYQKEKKKGNS